MLDFLSDNAGAFLLVTVALGGGAAWQAGRAVAQTWRPWWQALLYMFILGAAVRFIHFALFEGTLLSPQYYAVDTVVCLIFGFLGYRATRAWGARRCSRSAPGCRTGTGTGSGTS